jgi:peptide deformylase
MSLKELVVYPNPVLRETSEEVVEVGEDIRNLIDDMAETMYASHGIGLAAIQVGVPKRVIVVDVGEGLVALINPTIGKREGEVQMEEGCLCLPGVMVDVTRSERVTVKGLNAKGEEVSFDAEGLFSRALQHEIDHLDGILIVDKVSKIKRELLTSALRKQAKERTAAAKKS